MCGQSAIIEMPTLLPSEVEAGWCGKFRTRVSLKPGQKGDLSLWEIVFIIFPQALPCFRWRCCQSSFRSMPCFLHSFDTAVPPGQHCNRLTIQFILSKINLHIVFTPYYLAFYIVRNRQKLRADTAFSCGALMPDCAQAFPELTKGEVKGYVTNYYLDH